MLPSWRANLSYEVRRTPQVVIPTSDNLSARWGQGPFPCVPSCVPSGSIRVAAHRLRGRARPRRSVIRISAGLPGVWHVVPSPHSQGLPPGGPLHSARAPPYWRESRPIFGSGGVLSAWESALLLPHGRGWARSLDDGILVKQRGRERGLSRRGYPVTTGPSRYAEGSAA